MFVSPLEWVDDHASGTATVELTTGAVGEASLNHHELTQQAVVAAGIDPTAPGNQHIVAFEIHQLYATPQTDLLRQRGSRVLGSGLLIVVHVPDRVVERQRDTDRQRCRRVPGSLRSSTYDKSTPLTLAVVVALYSCIVRVGGGRVDEQ